MGTFYSSDPWSAIVILLTFGLFVSALFLKGLTHDVFVETAVFLVSLKLILMARNNAATEKRLEQRLIRIEELMARKDANSVS